MDGGQREGEGDERKIKRGARTTTHPPPLPCLLRRIVQVELIGALDLIRCLVVSQNRMDARKASSCVVKKFGEEEEEEERDNEAKFVLRVRVRGIAYTDPGDGKVG